MQENATPSEGVKGRISAKMALWVSVARVCVPYSFGRSGEMTENTTPSEGVKGRFTAKMAFEEVSCAQGHFGGAMQL